MKAVIMDPPSTLGAPGHWGISLSLGSGHISAWMGNHRVWRWTRGRQAGRLLISELDSGSHTSPTVPQNPHPQKKITTVPFLGDGRVRLNCKISAQIFIGSFPRAHM